MRAGVTIIVPAYNAQSTLTECLAALRQAMNAGDELIMFDDGSTDATRSIAIEAGARVVSGEGRALGPAHGRNVAAQSAALDLLLFVDADVILRADAIDLLAAEIRESGAAAAFGSYDDNPRSLRATSLYANLRHHFTHQSGRREAKTFWSGIGMIDKATFLALDGFDVAQFPYPSIEDVELGMRLVAAGKRIILVPEAQGTHWKDWSLWRVWHTDVVRRAIPWSRLIADGQVATPDLNLQRKERVLAVLALSLPAFLALALFWPEALFLAGFVSVAYILGNLPFFTVLARKLPLPKLVIAGVMHWCYHIYASVTFAGVLIATKVGLRASSGRAA